MRVSWIQVFCLAVLSLTPSCADDGVQPCDLWTASAVVSGRVTDGASGGPIVNTEVEVKVAAADECDGGEQWVHSRRGTTDANGFFSVGLELGNSRGVRCVGVTETNSGALVRGTVEFVGGCDETRPPGQLNLDLSI